MYDVCIHSSKHWFQDYIPHHSLSYVITPATTYSDSQKSYTRREEVHYMAFNYMKPVNYLFAVQSHYGFVVVAVWELHQKSQSSSVN